MAEGGSQHVAGVREGDILAGKYRIERILGVGGMAMVVAAHRMDLDQWVAIKFLLPEMLTNPDVVARFAREARAAVRITGEHVARVFDVGTLETGAPYIVMEYLQGIDLGMWIQQRGALPIAQAADFLIQACVAIAEAHGLGIIHRDIKPSNLFCVRGADGQLAIKVLDFGIAKIPSFNAAGHGIVTKTTAIMGSPLYMSPEQTQSARDVDSRADIWALGIVLYELLAGRVPFAGETMGEIIVKIATQTPEPLRSFRPDLPDGLEAIFRKCTEKDRERRYRNVGELALALMPFAPPSSKGAVEKISAIVQTRGLSATEPSVTPRLEGAAQTRSSTPAGTTQTGMGNTTRSPVPRSGRRRLVALSVIVAAGAGAIWSVSRLWPGTAPPMVRGSPTMTEVVSPTAPADDTRPRPIATTSELGFIFEAGSWVPTPPEAVTDAGAALVDAQPKQRLAEPPRMVIPSLPAPRVVPPPSPKHSCDPPYTVDAKGLRHPKSECL